MRVHAVLLCALLPAACARATTPPAGGQAAAVDAPPTTTPAPVVPPTAHAAKDLAGQVVETMDSGGYTYLRIQSGDGIQTWAAVRQATIAKGAQVTIVDAVAMDDFESPRLKRTFEHIVFGRLGGAPDEAPAAVAPVPVERAAGATARTVAEVHAQRQALQGQPVVVRGQVVKFLPGIMGRNWVHLRDGSGTTAAKDDDLTVTTSDTVGVGSVVTLAGTVSADKDFGSGYAYDVIVEGATLAR